MYDNVRYEMEQKFQEDIKTEVRKEREDTKDLSTKEQEFEQSVI